MLIGNRLKEIREEKQLSQGEVETKSGLLRCYISRVENGHTIPAVETLEKFARALDVPMYQLFYEGDAPPKPLNLFKRDSPTGSNWGSSGKEARMLVKFCRIFSRLQEGDQG